MTGCRARAPPRIIGQRRLAHAQQAHLAQVVEAVLVEHRRRADGGDRAPPPIRPRTERAWRRRARPGTRAREPPQPRRACRAADTAARASRSFGSKWRKCACPEEDVDSPPGPFCAGGPRFSDMLVDCSSVSRAARSTKTCVPLRSPRVRQLVPSDRVVRELDTIASPSASGVEPIDLVRGITGDFRQAIRIRVGDHRRAGTPSPR